MSKRILLLTAAALLLFPSSRIFATSVPIADSQMPQAGIDITHVQKKVERERLTDGVPSIPNPHAATNTPVTITVINVSGATWTDYGIEFVIPLPGKNNNVSVAGVNLTNSAFAKDKIGLTMHKAGQTYCELLLFDGSLPSGVDNGFQISLTLTYNNLVNVYGSPSVNHMPPVVPEPSSVFLLGTGALGLLSVMRRKLRM